MSKILIIPDVHLKPWMFDKAEEIIEKNTFDRIVLLGDLVDDWDQEKNLKLYKETLDRTIAFVEKYPDTLYCNMNMYKSRIRIYKELENEYIAGTRKNKKLKNEHI